MNQKSLSKRLLSLILSAFLFLTLLPAGSAFAAGAPTVLDINAGSITIGPSGSSGGGAAAEASLNPNGYVITGTGEFINNTITVATSTSITIKDVNIEVDATDGACAFSIETGANVSLTITGTNALYSGRDCAGLSVPDGAGVIIDGTGSLKAVSSAYGAGIGGNKGTQGGGGHSGTIAIRGGTVTANGRFGGAGIGGGRYESNGIITITGGTVTATSPDAGAGIGGGEKGSGGTITINDSHNPCVVTAASLSGTGIGGGVGGSGGLITIAGSSASRCVVTASCLYYSAGIGGGSGYYNPPSAGTINITGGTVTATGGLNAAGIGCSGIPMLENTSGTITIGGGSAECIVNATGGEGASGIGGLLYNYIDTITIGSAGSSNCFVTATAGDGWMGISGQSVTINGGTVHATGGSTGVGLQGNTITVNRGTVETLGMLGPFPNGVIFDGGSIKSSGLLSPPANSANTAVYPFEITGLPANAAVSAFTLTKGGIPYTYGAPAVVHSDGTLTPYLPNGTYVVRMRAGGTPYLASATISNGGVLVAAGLDEVALAKPKAEGAAYPTLMQEAALDEAAIKAALKTIADTAIANTNIEATVNTVSYTPPAAGTYSSPSGTNGSYTFTITVRKGALSETTAQQTLAIQAMVYKFTLAVENGSGSGSYKAGTVVAITADAPHSGMLFDKWTCSDAIIANTSSSTTTLTMPSANASVAATYRYQSFGGGAVPTATTQPLSVTVTTTIGNEIASTTPISGTYNPATHTASAVIDAKTAQDMLQRALVAKAAGKSADVNIAFGTLSDATAVAATFPAAQLSQMAAAKLPLKLQTGIETVTLSPKTLSAIAKKAGSDAFVTVSIERLDTSTLSARQQARVGSSPLYSFTVAVGDINLRKVGTLSVTLPYTPPQGKHPKTVTIYYVDGQGALRSARGKYDAKTGMVSLQINS